MKRILFTIICSYFLINNSFAQLASSDIIIGTNHTINSSILNQDRIIQIYLPDSYKDTSNSYPVLYILDGQWYFSSGVAIHKALRTPGTIPEMIVIGIENSNPLRRTLFGDESEKFTRFLKEEVVHFIDSNYRTTQDRVIFGWEDAAYYVSELIFKEPDLFTGAIISDGGYASENLVEGFSSDKEVYLFMANSRKDIYTIDSSEAFSEILKKKDPKHLLWKYDLFNDEEHETLPHLAIYKGLQYYYYNFGSPVFESIPQFVEVGGMSYLSTYFIERAERFGGDGKIDDDTKNTLIWLAFHRNNFEYFHFFMTEFEEVLSTKRYASAYWQNRLALFYLDHEDYNNAIKYFENGIEKYPNTDFQKSMEEGLAKAKNRSH